MISVALATHNEEKNLEKCLIAEKSWVDEIIVADGESTDQTVEIAKKFGAKIISTTNKANFHINKQLAMNQTTGDLVLQLDADEVVDAELATFIQHIDQKIDNPAAWWIRRKNFFMGRFLQKGGQYPDPVIRLYRKGRAHLPQKDVHEQMAVDGEVGWAEGHLLHYSNPTFADYMRKFNTYTSFKAHQLYERETPITFFSSLQYLFWKPLVTFVSLFFIHKAFVTDGVPGFVFAVFSGLHHSFSYLKLWEIYEKANAKGRL